MTDRERGAVLRLLDFSRVEAQALEVARKERTEEAGKVPVGLDASFGPWAAGHLADGTVVVVCSEGVGYEVTDESPFSLSLYARYDGGGIGIVPLMEAVMKPDDLQEYLTDETIDLADLVRTFGQRLEDNFWRLRRLLLVT
jgi:hypothetical protein